MTRDGLLKIAAGLPHAAACPKSRFTCRPEEGYHRPITHIVPEGCFTEEGTECTCRVAAMIDAIESMEEPARSLP